METPPFRMCLAIGSKDVPIAIDNRSKHETTIHMSDMYQYTQCFGGVVRPCSKLVCQPRSKWSSEADASAAEISNLHNIGSELGVGRKAAASYPAWLPADCPDPLALPHDTSTFCSSSRFAKAVAFSSVYKALCRLELLLFLCISSHIESRIFHQSVIFILPPT